MSTLEKAREIYKEIRTNKNLHYSERGFIREALRSAGASYISSAAGWLIFLKNQKEIADIGDNFNALLEGGPEPVMLKGEYFGLSALVIYNEKLKENEKNKNLKFFTIATIKEL